MTSTSTQPHARTEKFGVFGAFATVLGAALLGVAFFSLDWLQGPAPKFNDIRDQVEQFDGQAAIIPSLYYPWLAWTLAGAAIVLALASCVPSPASIALRVFGAVAGFAGVALTLLSIRILSSVPFKTFLDRVEPGFYVAATGFLLVGVGAMLGPRRPNPVGDAARVGKR